MKITVTLSLTAAVLAHFFAERFMGLFVNADEAAVIALGAEQISFTSLCYFVLGINFVVRFVLTGVGRSSVPLGVGILEIAIRCMGTYFLVYPYGFSRPKLPRKPLIILRK